MSKKNIPGRQRQRRRPQKSPCGKNLIIKKPERKVSRLTPTDSGKRDINAQLDQLFKDIPLKGPRVKTDLVRAFLKERE
jgi:hypothetical protein